MTLFDFSDPEAAKAFAPIDDVVMGGVSSSSFEATSDGSAVFSGRVSLENNGGFASVRSTRFDWNLNEAAGLALDVCGDGKRYKINLKTDPHSDATAYQAWFDTLPGIWQTIALPFQRFEPRMRGRVQEGMAPMDLSEVRTLGLMIANRQEGEFRLELRSIRALPRAR